jgi:hypothetical protein
MLFFSFSGREIQFRLPGKAEKRAVKIQKTAHHWIQRGLRDFPG